ncbi:cytochrome P450 26A1-like [Glandiceps talaboti]
MLLLESSILPSVLLPMILPCVLLVLAFKLWSIYIENTRDMNCQAPLPDGSMGLPFIGETVQLVLQGAEFYRKKYLKHGPIFKTHVLGRRAVRVVGTELVRQVLQGEGDTVTIFYPQSVRTLLGSHSVATSFGKEHEGLRKHLSKAFHINYLSRYIPYIQKYTDEAISEWCEQTHVVAQDECRTLLFRIAGKLLCNFDYSEHETRYLSGVFKDMVDNMFSLPIDLPGTAFNKALRARNILLSKIETSLKKKQENTDTEMEFVDALSLLSQITTDGVEAIETRQLKELALELLFAGHATSSNTATMLLVCLVKYPQTVTKLRQELEEHNLLDNDVMLSFETLSRLKYVGSVIKEVLRMYPPVGAGFRKVLRTFELGGKQIPAGWTVIFSIRETQMLAANFTKADEFNPDRFMPNRQEDKKGDRYSYVPFGAGPRGCVGKQLAFLMLKTFLIQLVRRCRWEAVSPENLAIQLLMTPHPVDGLPLRFTGLDCNANVIDFKKTDEDADIAY